MAGFDTLLLHVASNLWSLWVVESLTNMGLKVSPAVLLSFYNKFSLSQVHTCLPYTILFTLNRSCLKCSTNFVTFSLTQLKQYTVAMFRCVGLCSASC